MDSFILHLDTSTKVCSAAISKNGELISLKETLEDGYVHGEYLNLFIQEILKQAGITTSDLSAISLASGPGSYTGLRIGAATAKAICYAHKIPLIAIGTLESLAQLGNKKYSGINICAAVDARRMEVFSLIIDKNCKVLKEVSADVIEQNSYIDFEPFICVGDGADKLSDLWGERNCTIDGDIVSSALGQIELAYKKYKNEEFEGVAYWDPFYLKDFIVGKKG